MKRLIKEVNTKYYEDIDSDGKRTIRVETVTTKHFLENDGINQNPVVGTTVQYL
jgi:hypothetical protein|tara:strand:+ start:595 stop:756 length:162 start_codon:yes stop_codon:yes gene_type:complete